MTPSVTERSDVTDLVEFIPAFAFARKLQGFCFTPSVTERSDVTDLVEFTTLAVTL